jgi:DNA-binding transcriptional MerR regulator
MNIQLVEQKTGLTKRMIRHYEDIGLVHPTRDESNYRDYSQQDIDHLLCIKAMREIGFSLGDIGQIFKEGNTAEVLRSHLNELLFQQQEIHLAQKERVLVIKQLLNSKQDSIVDVLLDSIAAVSSPKTKSENVDDLNDFFRKHQVPHGHIKPVEDLRNLALLGFNQEFKIVDVQYSTYGRIFAENIFPRASISLCKQLYAHFILFTESTSSFGSEFHPKVLQQFSESWEKVAPPLSMKLDALTDDIASLENIFSMFELAVCIVAENSNEEKFELVIPGRALVVYLSREAGVEYNS